MIPDYRHYGQPALPAPLAVAMCARPDWSKTVRAARGWGPPLGQRAAWHFRVARQVGGGCRWLDLRCGNGEAPRAGRRAALSPLPALASRPRCIYAFS